MTRRDGRRLFCFGLGYSSVALIRRLPVADWHAGGTVRSAEKARALKADGIDAQAWAGGPLSPAIQQRLDQATHVLVSVPPDDDGDPVFNAAAERIAANDALQWLGYLSTTGVYGDTGGGVVDESAPANPSGVRGRRRVAAENAWLGLQADRGVPVHVFRLAGIYGPGRSAFEQLRRGTARRIDKPGHVFSRIHVDDIARVLAASIAKPRPGRIYNVCDDEPAAPAEVTAYAASLLGMEPPPLVDFEAARRDMSPMALSFWNDNRRVDNSRIRQELGVRLAYPDYRAGLQAVLAEHA